MSTPSSSTEPTATTVPATTTAARYCTVLEFTVYSDGSGVIALLKREGFGFACHYLGGKTSRYLSIAPSRNAKPPKRVIALGAAMYADDNG